MKIFLVGMMGSGKSTLGAALAERLRVPFIDLDAEVAHRLGRSIQSMFGNDEDMARFRQTEAHVLADQALTDSFVMATGGGTPLHHNGMERMLNAGTVIHLHVPVPTLWKRIEAQGTHRPLAQNQEAFALLYHQRLPTYRLAHCTIMADQTIEDAVDLILQSITPKPPGSDPHQK